MRLAVPFITSLLLNFKVILEGGTYKTDFIAELILAVMLSNEHTDALRAIPFLGTLWVF